VTTVSAVIDIENPSPDKVAVAQLAIDCEIELSKVARGVSVVKVDPDGSDVIGPQRWLLSDQLALIPRDTGLIGFREGPPEMMGVQLKYPTSTTTSEGLFRIWNRRSPIVRGRQHDS
jgi:hypothetical protein